MTTPIQIHLAGVFRGGCRPVHNQAVLHVGPDSVGVSRFLAHKDGTCGQRGRERGRPRSASILIPCASRVPARDLQRGLIRSPSPLSGPAADQHAYGHPKWWAGLPVPAAPYSCGENWTGTASATSGDGRERTAPHSHSGAPVLAPVPVRGGVSPVARCLVTGAGGLQIAPRAAFSRGAAWAA